MFLLWTMMQLIGFWMVLSLDVLRLVSKMHVLHLNNYESYSDTTVLHFQIPPDTLFLSLIIESEIKEEWLFSRTNSKCKPEIIEFHMKEGSPAIINPENSKTPTRFVNLTRPKTHSLYFTNKSPIEYLNLTSPNPGMYFITTYLAYSDPRKEGVKPAGLTPKCFVNLNVSLCLLLRNEIDIFIKNIKYEIIISLESSAVSKFLVPDNVDHVLVQIWPKISCEDCQHLNIRIDPFKIPYSFNNESTTAVDIPFEKFSENNSFVFWTPHQTALYYIRFEFTKQLSFSTLSKKGSLTFNMKYIKIIEKESYIPVLVLKQYRGENISITMPYFEYNTITMKTTERTLYAILYSTKGKNFPIELEMNGNSFYVLKFSIPDQTYSGGVILLRLKGLIDSNENEVVVCLRKGLVQLPLNSTTCISEESTAVPVFVNRKAFDNKTIIVPYPEPGIWYLSLRLFCERCQICYCTNYCQEMYENCIVTCENKCKTEDDCSNCSETCRITTLTRTECEDCDCIGGCKKNIDCNSSFTVEISSILYLQDICGIHGQSILSIFDGFSLSSCRCLNNYKGWDCADDSLADSYFTILSELLLLTLSNLMFIPVAYVAYKRKYYVESIIYSALCLSSTFYHACDAGENIISFCIVPLRVLQFCDFFSALLSFWATLIAIAYLNQPLISILHIIGAIGLAFGTTYKIFSLGLLVSPIVIGLIIVFTSWGIKMRKFKKLFPSKRYLVRNFALGLVFVGFGLSIFGFFQTKSNYKYLHSLWHVLVAVAVIIILTDEKTFLPSYYMQQEELN